MIRVDGEIELSASADPATDPTLVLRVAAGRRPPRRAASSAARSTGSPPTVAARGRRRGRPARSTSSSRCCSRGTRAIPVLEALDQRGLLTRLLPEWEPVRSRPQRNAYHRFTVDRHLWETAANAAELVDRVARPDLLVLGALFHDIGKGYPGDHTEAGMEVVRGARAPARLGLADDATCLIAMVEHHLLLPDVAVRRDLTDPATISHVADAVGDRSRCSTCSHALTEADSKATGPSAWGAWKEELVADLVARVAPRARRRRRPAR